MWRGGFLVVVVVVVVDSVVLEGIVPDIPEYAKCANMLFDRVQSRLTTDIDTVTNTISSMNTKLDSTVIEIHDKMNAIENTVHAEMDAIASKEDMDFYIGNMTHSLEDMLHYMGSTGNDMDTEDGIKELVNTKSEEIVSEVREVKNMCGNDAKIDAVMEEVRDMRTELAAVGRSSRMNAKTCLQESNNRMDRLNSNMEELQGKMMRMELTIDEKLDSLQNLLWMVFSKNLDSSPSTPPPTTTTTTTEPTTTTTTTTTTEPTTTTTSPGHLYPCEDTNYRGITPFNMCQSAVRFKKCHLHNIAFHCCRSCTDAGLLPSIGPWRYMERPRFAPSYMQRLHNF